MRSRNKVAIVASALPEDVSLKPAYKRTDLVDQAVHTVVKALVEGSILVAIVLILFLGELHSALVVISALPLAMLIAFTQPIQMRVEELTLGVRATVAIKLYGEDLRDLDRLSEQIKGVVAQVPGVADLSLEANLGKPQIRVQVDRLRLARYGRNADEVLTLVRNGIGNEPVSTLIDGVRRFDITVRLPDASKETAKSIGAISLPTGVGAVIPLSRVAVIDVAEGYSFVRREQLQRYAVIQMDVRGRDVDGLVREANEIIAAQVELPPGYWIEWGAPSRTSSGPCSGSQSSYP